MKRINFLKSAIFAPLAMLFGPKGSAGKLKHLNGDHQKAEHSIKNGAVITINSRKNQSYRIFVTPRGKIQVLRGLDLIYESIPADIDRDRLV